MTGRGISEDLRKSIHILMVGFAFLLKHLPWWGAALLAAAAVVSNATWIPRLRGGALMREGEERSILQSGVWLYSLAVLALILVFPHRLEIVACAWGILALGDGFATLIGRRLPHPALPWNRRKSWAGFLSFCLAGTLGGAALLRYVSGGSFGGWGRTLLVSAVAASACALVESLSLKLNDNLSVPFLAAGIVVTLDWVRPEIWSANRMVLQRNLLLGLAVVGAFALAARVARTVSWSGVAGGILVGLPIATFGGLPAFWVLVAFFILGSAATRVGWSRKAQRGIAQEGEGARGALHALANVSVPAYLAFLSGSVDEPMASALRLAFVASLATAACDTLGSEIGQLSRSEPFLITRLRSVAAGTPGAVSLLGTAAGICGAVLVGGAAATLQIIPWSWIPIVAAAALLGAVLESLLGATAEPADLIDSETMNFLNTLAGALAAVALLPLAGAFS